MNKILFMLVASSMILSGVLAQNSSNTCNATCPSGCFFNNGRERCTACPAGCNICSDANTLLACYPGYFLDEKQNCVSCDVYGCANCTGPQVCTACESGLFLTNATQCEPCGNLCDVCSSSNRMQNLSSRKRIWNLFG